MPRSSLQEIHETIKIMLGYALALSENPIPTVYELAHYLADNILAKICLAVAIDKGEEQQTYLSSGWTKGLPRLYNDHLKIHYPQVPDYDPIIKVFHEERNVYQHDVDSFDMTMRQPRARSFVSIIEQIMRTVGIINIGEVIQPKNLTNSNSVYDNNARQTRAIETKYQQLHDLLKTRNDEDIIIKIKNKLDIGTINQLNNILSMDSTGPQVNHIILWNSKFQIAYLPSISGDQFSIQRKGTNNASYTPVAPDVNRNVLDDFLQYYRECFGDNGININP
ncbi:MAG: hypothetical protein ACW986_18930 [Promethearchaeota archaeon]|jgi:hypothetical protein